MFNFQKCSIAYYFNVFLFRIFYFYSLSFLAFHYNNVFSQTTVPGGSVGGIWSKNSSPYLIAGSIYIPDDSTLTIEPGVEVNFQNTYKLLVLGRLIAVGTQSDSITFISQDTTAGWRGVRFENTPVTNDTSKIIFCKFFYSKSAGSGETPDAIYIDNFSRVIIKNNLISYCKGAIRVLNCNPVIEYNTVSSNIGSCISLYNSNIEFKFNVVISNSLSSTATGAIHANNMNGKISKNTIMDNNIANSYGGGIFLINGNTIVDSNEIGNNQGSGIFKGWNSANSQIISNNFISNNTSSGIYGYANNIFQNIIIGNSTGISSGWNYCPGSQVTIERNIIANNTQGGMTLCSNVTVSNNVIVNNGKATTLGGAIYCDNASPALINNTIANNLGLKGGAIFCENNSDPTFINNIVWGNTANNGSQIFLDDENSDPSFYYCDIQGGQLSIDANFNIFMGSYLNNIDSNPLFANPSSGEGSEYDGINSEWYVLSGSTCIDAGNPVGTYPIYDYAGNPRITGNKIDIGAYEYPTVQTGIATIRINNKILVFPNPNNGQFYINYQGKGICKIKIFDIRFFPVYQNEMADNHQNYFIDAKDKLSTGIYFVQIETTQRIFIEKLIVDIPQQ